MKKLEEYVIREIKNAFLLLLNNDDELIGYPISDSENLESFNNRELHEVCINHKLAIYLENTLLKFFKKMNKF
ncbi:MAG: hypothetical protein ACTSRZ_18870 [Promethearchaeota archaeon]